MLLARRSRSASGENRFRRAVASSIASGSPSSRRQISATAAALSSVSRKSERTARARSTNSWIASNWLSSDAFVVGWPMRGQRQRRHRDDVLAADPERLRGS